MIKVRDKNKVPSILEEIEKLSTKTLKVGVLGRETSHVLMVATVQEYGIRIKMTDKMRKFLFAKMRELNVKPDPNKGDGDGYVDIPERSFIRSTFDKRLRDIKRLGEKGVGSVIAGRITADNFFESYGEVLTNFVQDQIINLKDPPNSPLTIAAKGSNNPLVDRPNGLKNKITHMVV